MYGNVFYSGGSVPDMDEDFCKAVIKLSDNFAEQEATVIDGRTDTNIRSNSLYAIDDEKFKAIGHPSTTNSSQMPRGICTGGQNG